MINEPPVKMSTETDDQFEVRWQKWNGAYVDSIVSNPAFIEENKRRFEYWKIFYKQQSALGRATTILDDERDHSSIEKTSRRRRWLHPIYENLENNS